VNKVYARRMGTDAIEHMEGNHPLVLGFWREFPPIPFRNLRLKAFLTRYCWAIYSSGRKYHLSGDTLSELKDAFKGFETEPLRRMRSVSRVLAVESSEKKARDFLTGAKQIIDEGFSRFKGRLEADGSKVLKELPGLNRSLASAFFEVVGVRRQYDPVSWLPLAASKCEAIPSELLDYLSLSWANITGSSRAPFVHSEMLEETCQHTCPPATISLVRSSPYRWHRGMER
jgi:hypothetical protein